MFANQQSNVPKKGSIVLNPKTSRPVKVGGATWRKLVKEGLLNGNYQDSKHLEEIKSPEKAEEQIKTLNETLPVGVQAVRGRGKYKGKLVKRNKQLNSEEVAKMLSKIVNNNIEKLSEADDLEAELEKLLLGEMVPQPKLVRQSGIYKKKKQKEYYRLEEADEYDTDGNVSTEELSESENEEW